MRILLIEDEIRLVEALEYILKKNNYLVDAATDGQLGQEMAESGIYDIIVLDIMLPKKDGLQVLQELRRDGIKTPIILLTARDTVKDKVAGLDLGADDYLVKPFSTEELLARLRAMGRRKGELMTVDNTLRLSNLVLDTSSCEISCSNSRIKLTVKESSILELLLRNAGNVLTKELILDRVWGMDSDAQINNIEVYLSFIRKKLSSLKANVVIETVRGVGYSIKEV